MQVKSEETNVMNQQDNQEPNNQQSPTESLADLPLTDEQTEEAKAGRTGFIDDSLGSGQQGSGGYINHNETITEDEEAS